MPLLQLLIAEHFDGEVWRMEIDPVNHLLFAEIRHITDHKVSFASLSLQDGTTYFKNFAVNESWLTGIETAYRGVVLLHYYQTASLPTHKGLAAIDGQTGDLLWYNYNYSFDQLTQNGPVLYDSRLQPPTYFLADITNGNRLRGYQPVTDPGFDPYVVTPEVMPLPPDLPPLPVEPYGNNVHYLLYNNLIIVSLHALRAGTLMQYLYIFAHHKLVYEDILNTNIQKLQPEAFVLYQNKLIYLKDRSEIKVINL